MFELIKKLNSFTVGECNSRSLLTAKVGSKKRTRRQYEAAQELSTILDVKAERQEKFKT